MSGSQFDSIEGVTGSLVNLDRAASERCREPHEIYKRSFESAMHRICERVIGRKHEIEITLHTMFAEGHALFEGRSGLGKTTLIKRCAEAFDLSYARIQCQPDLMPQQIIGFMKQTDSGEELIKYGIFHNVVLLDEINRATPEAQAALLEAMSEGAVSISGKTFDLPRPFNVLASQNSFALEAGTFPLPIAELDRFMVCITPGAYSAKELSAIGRLDLDNASERLSASSMEPEGEEAFIELIKTRRSVVVPNQVIDWTSECLKKLDPYSPSASEEVKNYLSVGQPELARALEGLLKLAQSRALLEGRTSVEKEDIPVFMENVLLHRLILSRKGEAEARNASGDQLKRRLAMQAFQENDD